MFTRSVVSAMIIGILLSPAAPGEEARQDEMAGVPMGAPEQMKELAYQEGDWRVDMQWVSDDDPNRWDESQATCSFQYILDGCAMECIFKSTDMVGAPFEGYQLMTYDRDRNEWQSMWLDNMGGKMSLYTGQKKNGKMTFLGKEIWQGKEYLSRVIIFNEMPDRFEWAMDSSFDNGQTWQPMGKAVYTKR